jgi:spore germination cell wall hydrolase CwlJ-like protein
MVTALFKSYEDFLLALCIWREARGQANITWIAIKHVILNRVAHPAGPYSKCKTITQTILRNAYPSRVAAQFSSFNRGDANSSLLPDPGYSADWRAFQDICTVVGMQTADPTGGADAYYDTSIPPPVWATQENFLCHLGAFKFHKLY